MHGGRVQVGNSGGYEKASGQQGEGHKMAGGCEKASGQRREGGWDACIRRRPRDEG